MSEWDFAFGLTEQALEDALSSGTTSEEWAMIERELERAIIGDHGKNVFAFIDAENIPSKFWEQIEQCISYLVDKCCKKIYALQKDDNLFLEILSVIGSFALSETVSSYLLERPRTKNALLEKSQFLTAEIRFED